MDGTKYQWVDLDGEGIAGILTEESGSWFYKHNISSLPLIGKDGNTVLDNNGKPVVFPRFEPVILKSKIHHFQS